MNLRLALGTGFLATLIASSAGAQEVTIGYQGLPYKATGETPTGIQVSDGVLLHVGAGAEGGYDTNVFYESTAPRGSAIVRVLPYAEITNATRTGATSRQLAFNARAALQYRRYLSDDPSVKMFDNAWMPTAGLSLGIGGGQFGFGIADTFARIEEPPYANSGGCSSGMPGCVPSAPITRNNNQASVEGRWSPGGGRLTGLLRYTNMIDIFEGSYSYASSDTNQLMVDVAWKWLPKTAVFASAQQGFVTYLNDAEATQANKVSSYPLRVTAGLRGLLTDKTAAVLSLGYNNAFYSSGPSTGGFLGSTYAELALTVRPTQLSRVVGGFRHDFVNAVISSFSYNETAYLSYVQQVAGRLALDLSARYVYRNYGGLFVDPAQVGRRDNFFQVGATLDYFMRNWTYFGLAYALLANSSNYDYLNYTKQQVFVRLGITY